MNKMCYNKLTKQEKGMIIMLMERYEREMHEIEMQLISEISDKKTGFGWHKLISLLELSCIFNRR